MSATNQFICLRRAGDGAVGTINTTITGQRFEQGFAALALPEEYTGIGRHPLRLLKAAFRTYKGRYVGFCHLLPLALTPNDDAHPLSPHRRADRYLDILSIVKKGRGRVLGFSLDNVLEI